MTNEQFLKEYCNPWVEVADMYKPENSDCLFGDDNNYVCTGDKVAIDNYNDKVKGTSDEIETRIPAEPWWGNPLKARLIILSLNPGYVPEVNKTLAMLMQTNEVVRRKLIEYKAQTLRLEATSFLPEDKEGQPISCRDAVNMLGDWYWVKMLRQLREDTGLEEKEFYRRIALVEYHGYSSQTSGRIFPRKKDKLASQAFLKDMLWYIAESKKDKVHFLIMRAKDKWKELLTDEFFKYFNSSIIEKKSSSMISQYITPANFEGNIYQSSLVEFLKRNE